MGIYDREYYRKEGPSYLDALIPQGQVCKWLIGINVLVYILQLVTKQRGGQWGPISEFLDLNTDQVMRGQVWRLLTYAFLHSPETWTHIFFNMLFLWWFGSEIEIRYGSKEFLAFYLVTAVVGGLAFQAQALVMGHTMYCVGASGAVTAVLVLYACNFPHATILLFFIVPVPIWLFVIFNVALDLYPLLMGTPTPTAVSVHLGGAAFAGLYYLQGWRIMSLWQAMQSWRRQQGKPKLRVYHPEEQVPVPVASAQDLDEHLDAKLDAVLEKLSLHGRESLTETERDILLKASEIYKKKRH